jgi:hypothetical protein
MITSERLNPKILIWWQRRLQENAGGYSHQPKNCSQSKQKYEQTPIIFTKLRKAQTKAYTCYIFSWTIISVEL